MFFDRFLIALWASCFCGMSRLFWDFRKIFTIYGIVYRGLIFAGCLVSFYDFYEFLMLVLRPSKAIVFSRCLDSFARFLMLVDDVLVIFAECIVCFCSFGRRGSSPDGYFCGMSRAFRLFLSALFFLELINLRSVSSVLRFFLRHVLCASLSFAGCLVCFVYFCYALCEHPFSFCGMSRLFLLFFRGSFEFLRPLSCRFRVFRLLFI